MRWHLKSPASRLFIKRLFRRWSKKTSKLYVTGLCAGNSPVTSEFPTQRASGVENVSIWWRHHAESTCNWLECMTIYIISNIVMSLICSCVVVFCQGLCALYNIVYVLFFLLWIDCTFLWIHMNFSPIFFRVTSLWPWGLPQCPWSNF